MDVVPGNLRPFHHKARPRRRCAGFVYFDEKPFVARQVLFFKLTILNHREFDALSKVNW
jgi:hypothetical protein